MKKLNKIVDTVEEFDVEVVENELQWFRNMKKYFKTYNPKYSTKLVCFHEPELTAIYDGVQRVLFKKYGWVDAHVFDIFEGESTNAFCSLYIHEDVKDNSIEYDIHVPESYSHDGNNDVIVCDVFDRHMFWCMGTFRDKMGLKNVLEDISSHDKIHTLSKILGYAILMNFKNLGMTIMDQTGFLNDTYDDRSDLIFSIYTALQFYIKKGLSDTGKHIMTYKIKTGNSVNLWLESMNGTNNSICVRAVMNDKNPDSDKQKSLGFKFEPFEDETGCRVTLMQGSTIDGVEIGSIDYRNIDDKGNEDIRGLTALIMFPIVKIFYAEIEKATVDSKEEDSTKAFLEEVKKFVSM